MEHRGPLLRRAAARQGVQWDDADRRFRTAEIRAERPVESLDRADGEPDRLHEAAYRRQLYVAVRRIADVFDKSAPGRSDGCRVSPPYSIQDQAVRANSRRISPDFFLRLRNRVVWSAAKRHS